MVDYDEADAEDRVSSQNLYLKQARSMLGRRAVLVAQLTVRSTCLGSSVYQGSSWSMYIPERLSVGAGL